MQDFIAVFEGLDDPRTGNATRHDLHEALLIAVLTTLCGGEGCADMELFAETKLPFLRTFMTLEHGPPSHDTFSRLFRLLDPAQFRACFIAFMQRFAHACEGVVAFDGKTLRRSFDTASAASPLHMVSAFAADARLVLGQIAVDDKSNEITAMPKLIDMLLLKGCVVTADALNCQREIARKICDKEADYALALKGNQGSRYNDVQTFLDDPETVLDVAETTDGGHGRIEIRTASVSADIDWLQETHDWPGLAAVGKIVSTRESRGKTSTETRYYLLSTPFPAARLNDIVRSHWAIENSLHWVLDVTMNEDRLRNRLDNGPENLAMLRHLALNVAKLEPSKNSMRGKFKRAGWDDRYLLKLLAQFGRVDMR
jgi:predicted transposase YbfD/YdcC